MEEISCRKMKAVGRKGIRYGLYVAATVSYFGVCGEVGAFQVDTGNEDFSLRWDNTFRYTYANRVKEQNKSLLGDANIDDGNRNFDKGTVSNRLDVLSEFDAAYMKSYGVRVSAAGWYDQAYDSSLDNKSAFTSNHLVNGQAALGLSHETERYYRGPSGELLDAFAYGKFNLGEVPVNVKVGRHTILWGEALLGSGGVQGINYGQSPIDVGKLLAQPGVEIKEMLRPRNQVSLQAQPTSELTVAAQYYLQWEESRMPGAGSYLSFADLLGPGSESLVHGFAPGPPPSLLKFSRGKDVTPGNSGDWGISTRWSPSWLEGTVGLYYRNFSDNSAQMVISPMTNSYHFVYASDIQQYGISLSQQKFGVSIGSEVNYRRNMPLQSEATLVGPAFIPGVVAATLPGSGDTYGTRGDTVHAVVNFLKLFSDTPVFNTAALMTEFTWDRWLNTTQGENFFKGRSGYNGKDRVTKNHVAGAVIFTPTWYQVFNGVDLSMPTSIAMGLAGTSAMIAETNNKHSGQYGFGLSADIFQRYKVDLTYTGFIGTFEVDPASGQVLANGSPFPNLKDRDMIALTLKTTF